VTPEILHLGLGEVMITLSMLRDFISVFLGKQVIWQFGMDRLVGDYHCFALRKACVSTPCSTHCLFSYYCWLLLLWK